MGLALHIAGLGWLLHRAEAGGAAMAAFYLYTAVAVAGAGWLVDVRFVTALAIAPFAQMLDTGTSYFSAMYVFYSPESTLTIIQICALMALALWLAARSAERTARHWRTLAIFGFIVANLSALVGSLWGDVIGDTVWGPGAQYWLTTMDYDTWEAARLAFEQTTITISANLYSVLWALGLAAMVAFAAHKGNRALFNASVTFAGIHLYTQVFESFYDQPLAYVIGGFGAIPLAWGMWRLNLWFGRRTVN